MAVLLRKKWKMEEGNGGQGAKEQSNKGAKGWKGRCCIPFVVIYQCLVRKFLRLLRFLW
jgi:hypothetical protein